MAVLAKAVNLTVSVRFTEEKQRMVNAGPLQSSPRRTIGIDVA